MGAEQRLHSINIMYDSCIPVVAGYKRAGWSHAGSPVDSWKIPAIHRSINSSGDRQYNTFIHLYTTLHHCCWGRYGSLTHSWQSISFSFFKKRPYHFFFQESRKNYFTARALYSAVHLAVTEIGTSVKRKTGVQTFLRNHCCFVTGKEGCPFFQYFGHKPFRLKY